MVAFSERIWYYYFGVRFMADYKQMYLTLLDGVEKAMETLISAQRACEELYIDTAEEEKAISADFDKK